jgi:hypothetical protein
MKLKYMLRGLGIGVIVTAAIMGAYNRNAVADAKAQARVDVLREYGFGEEPTLVDNESESEEETSEIESETEETIPIIIRDEVKESEVESVIESAKAAEKETETEPESSSVVESNAGEAKATEIKSETDVAKESESSSESESESKSSSVPSYIDVNDVVEVPETIDITVAKGDDSGTVSRKLYNAGIVDSASEYDAYLMQHGYDKKISVGTKTINVTDTWQEIAEKLTGK